MFCKSTRNFFFGASLVVRARCDVPARTGRDQLIASFRPLPGRNFGTLAALILMVAPVRGLRPLRAARLPTTNVLNPT